MQEQAINIVLGTECDLLIAAPTASGKTEAAMLPIASTLAEKPTDGLACLYISPLKALINDQFPRAESLFGACDVPVTAWHGDVPRSQKTAFLKQPKGTLLITPESLEALLMTRGAITAELFSPTRFVVLDEVHAFAGTERGAQVQSLLARIERASGRRMRRIGLSATAGDLRTVAEFLRPQAEGEIVTIIDRESRPSVKRIRGVIDEGCGQEEVVEWLYHSLRGSNNLVFANRRSDVETYADALRELCDAEGTRPEFEAHHGSLSREHREEVEYVLKHSTESTTVVASSTLELGIDVGTIERVVQIGAPPSVASLQQRLGRSGRRCEPPVLDAIIIAPATPSVLEDQLRAELVQTVATVELINRRWYEPPITTALHLSTLVQQFLSLVVQCSGTTQEEAFSVLCSTGPFAQTTRTQFHSVTSHLIEIDILYRYDSGLLVLGERGDKLVKAQTFYAAFATPVEYSIVADDRVLGTLPLTDSIESTDSLTFAARRWRILRIDHDRKRIHVGPTDSAEAAQFLGSSISVHDEVRREMLRIYMSDAIPEHLDEVASRLLQEGRESFAKLGLESSRIIAVKEDCLLIPWVGDRVMNTMRLQLLERGMSVKKSPLTLRVRKCSPDRVLDLLPALEIDDTPAAVLAQHARSMAVHKHHRRLPVDLLALDYASEFLHVDGAAQAWSALRAAA
ncbi:MAG TPA: DEAD/DEAH box helicase [Thermoanaerobaculia bacterium]